MANASIGAMDVMQAPELVVGVLHVPISVHKKNCRANRVFLYSQVHTLGPATHKLHSCFVFPIILVLFIFTPL